MTDRHVERAGQSTTKRTPTASGSFRVKGRRLDAPPTALVDGLRALGDEGMAQRLLRSYEQERESR